MGLKLHIGDNLDLPADTVTQTIVVYGGKGMGKTNFAAVLCEELSRAKLRFSLLDPVGVSWGLRHSADGKGPGIDALILGGRHGDIPIEPTGGAVVADLVADEDVSTIVDISSKRSGELWGAGEKIRFTADYCLRLFSRQGEHRRPLMQIIDEAGRFVPQQIPAGAVDIARCVGAIEQLVELGRNVGVGVGLITQRSARMNKSVSELAECMIAFRTVGPRSIDAILDWLGEHIPKQRWNEMLEKLRSLPVGQALVVSPGWLDFEDVVEVRMRETFDSSATPKPGQRERKVGKPSQPDLRKYQERMAATIEKAKAEDPHELRKKIAELERELRAAPAFADQAIQKELKNWQDRALLETKRHLDHGERINKELQALHAQLIKLSAKIPVMIDDISGSLNTLSPMPPFGQPPIATMHDPEYGRALRPAKSVSRHIDTDQNGTGKVEAISGPERRILDAIAWQEAIGIEEPKQVAVAFLANYTYGAGGFNNARGSLRTKGLVEYRGDRIVLTDAGRRLAKIPDGYLTREELHRRVLQILPNPEQRILRPLLDSYPKPLADDELAEKANYVPGTGGFNNPKGRLRSLGLIEYPAPRQAVASAVLFFE
jgi:uncharacterized protein